MLLNNLVLKNPDYDKLIDSLYLTVRPFICDISKKNPEDLLVMGEIVDLEYKCLAIYKSKFGILPEFNDMKRSPKK